MEMDLVYVTHQSQKWVEQCFASLVCSEIELGEIAVYTVDNASTDQTVCRLEQIRNQYAARFRDFQVIRSKKNLGFGRANNIGFRKGKASIVCFFNIDTKLCRDTLQILQQNIRCSSPKTALWELRQFPYEHPKQYDVLSLETGWSSGAAFAVKRSVFDRVGGFDAAFFMYAEDVDLSWRIRSFGYRLAYVPKAVLYHYAYEKPGQVKPAQYINGRINQLFIRLRFGNWKDLLNGHLLFWRGMCEPQPFPGARVLLWKAYVRHFRLLSHFRSRAYGKRYLENNDSGNGYSRKRYRCGNAAEFHPVFIGMDYSGNREGAFYYNEFPQERPLVSVILCAYGDRQSVKNSLVTLQNQTYEQTERRPDSQTNEQTDSRSDGQINEQTERRPDDKRNRRMDEQSNDQMEVMVLVPESHMRETEQMLRQEFSELRATVRALEASMQEEGWLDVQMQRVRGAYIHVISDNMLLYADHIEVLVRALECTDGGAVRASGMDRSNVGTARVFSMVSFADRLVRKNYDKKRRRYEHKEQHDADGGGTRYQISEAGVMFTRQYYEAYKKERKPDKDTAWRDWMDHAQRVPKTTFLHASTLQCDAVKITKGK